MCTKRRLKNKTKNPNKTCIKDLLLLVSSVVVLFFVLILCFGLTILNALVISVIALVLMISLLLLLFFVKYLYKGFSQEPFTTLIGLLVAIFISLPLLFLLFRLFKVEDLPNVIKGFLSIVIPIGVNSAFDGLFKIIETHFDSKEKEQVVRYGGSLKFIFNSLYLATTLAIFTVQNTLLPLYEKKDTFSICFLKFTKREIWGTLPVFTIFYFICIILFALVTSSFIQKEIKNSITKR